MAEKLTKLKIFVASPGDVQEERDRLPVVIDELNRGVAAQNGLVLELVRWETHAWPGIGEDAQDVINREIGPSDIFIGIMWKRFGTATKRAASGTVEEFERAYEFWRTYQRPHIMFYFDRTPFYPISEQELEQMQRVISFRSTLQQKGVLFWEYEGATEFESIVRQHLTKVILQWSREDEEAIRPVLPTICITTRPTQMPSRTPTIAVTQDQLAPQSLLEQQYGLFSVDWYADGKLALASRGGDVHVIGLDGQTHTQMRTQAYPTYLMVHSERKLAAMSYKQVYMLDLESDEKRVVEVDPHASGYILAWNSIGNYLAVGTTNTVKIFTPTLDKVAEHHVGGKFGAPALTWGGGENILYVGLGNGELWRLVEPFDTPTVLMKGPTRVLAVRSSRTDDRIACLWQDGTLEVRRDGELLASMVTKPMSNWIAAGPKLAWCLNSTVLACVTGVSSELILWHVDSGKALSCGLDRKPLAVDANPSGNRLAIATDERENQDAMVQVLDLSKVSVALTEELPPQEGEIPQPHLVTADWTPLLDLIEDQRNGVEPKYTLALDIPSLKDHFYRYEENLRKADAEPAILRSIERNLQKVRKQAEGILDDLLWMVERMSQVGYFERDICTVCDRVVSFSANNILGKLGVQGYPQIESLQEFVAFSLGYARGDLLYLGFDAHDGRGNVAYVPFEFLANVDRLVSIGETLGKEYGVTTLSGKISAGCQLFHDFDYVFSSFEQTELWTQFVLPLSVVRYPHEKVIVHPSEVASYGLA